MKIMIIDLASARVPLGGWSQTMLAMPASLGEANSVSIMPGTLA